MDGITIELDRIKNKADLLEWVHHLCEKAWSDDSGFIRFLIDVVLEKKGWEIRN